MGGGRGCETSDDLRDRVGRVDECTGGSLRCCRSLPAVGDAPLGGREAGGATLVKVMVHSTSSPANTAASFQRTSTRRLDAAMVQQKGGGGSSWVSPARPHGESTQGWCGVVRAGKEW